MSLSLAAAFLATIRAIAAGAPGVVTPSPIMIGFPNNCETFFLVNPGDICANLEQEHQINLGDFLRFNPYINGPDDCPAKLFANYYYCRQTQGVEVPSAPTTPPPPPPPPTPDDKTEISPPPTTAAPSPPPPPPPPPPPHPTSCEVHNACYRAFAGVNPMLATSQSSWCTSLLGTTATESAWDKYPGAPLMVTSVCSTVFPTAPAADVLTSYCACLTAGQFGDQAHPTGHGAQQNKRDIR